MWPEQPVYKFRTPGGWYVYDPPTNRILRVSPAVYDLVDLYHDLPRSRALSQLSSKHGVPELERAHDLVTEIVQRWGALANRRLQQNVSYTTEDDVRSELQKGVSQCTLELTQACNLRCRYCIYSGDYPHHRVHGASHMSWATAKAAVDLFAAQNRAFQGDFASLGFYGGEPLLRFPLVRDVIEYAKSVPALVSSDLCFSLTTNATMLTEQMVKYFEENNLSLLISLDGPKDVHDQNRVFPDGSGSFGRVLSAIRSIRRIAPDYYRSRVHFSATISPDADLLLLRDFFDDSELFSAHRMRTNAVAPGNASYYRDNPAYFGRDADLSALLADFIDKRVMMQDASNLSTAMFEQQFVLLHRRPIFQGPIERDTTSKACFPGGRKIYVACDGTVHICEKMNPHFPIGHVRAGLDVERITGTINQFADLMNQRDCLECWAFRLCNVCFATLDGPGRFLQATKHELCPAHLAQAKQTLAAYCWAKERNPHVWDYLDSYTLA